MFGLVAIRSSSHNLAPHYDRNRCGFGDTNTDMSIPIGEVVMGITIEVGKTYTNRSGKTRTVKNIVRDTFDGPLQVTADTIDKLPAGTMCNSSVEWCDQDGAFGHTNQQEWFEWLEK